MHWGFLFFLTISLSVFSHAIERLDGVVAVVNYESIGILELEKEATLIQREQPTLTDEKAQQQALNQLIERHLQLQHAKLQNIKVSDKLLQQRLDEIKSNLNIETKEQLNSFVQQNYGLSIADFTHRIQEDLLIQGLFYNEVYSRVRVYEDELEQFLLNETEAHKLPEYRLGHILISTEKYNDEAKQIAETVQKEAKKGSSFSDLAKEYSTGAEAKLGGDLGFREEKNLPSTFAEAAHNLKEGEVSEVIETSAGYHILKLFSIRSNDVLEKIERLHLFHIFLPKEDLELGRKIKRELESGAHFSTLVKQYSKDSISISKQGEIGWIEREKLPFYFVKPLKDLKKGDISDIIISPFGLHIVLLAQIEVKELDIQIMRDQAEKALRQRRALARRDIWLRKLRSDAYIRIFDPRFEVYNR